MERFFFETFPDASVYFMIALIGTVLFIIRFIFMLAGAGHGDFHVDTADSVEHGTGFGLFSLISITAFMVGFGWMGVACRHEWRFGHFASAMISFGFGSSLMVMCSYGMMQMRKFEESGQYNVQHALGQIGRVYLRIPPKGQGRGQVEITVDGRRKVLYAASNGAEIPSFAAVRVLAVESDETLIVEAQ